MLGRLAAGVSLLALISGCAFGQSSPNWANGYVPTPAQWNAEWASKQDYIGPLGNGATLNIGTTAGTLAAGNDPRITGAVQAANNGSDFASPATVRVNLGLGSIATQNASAVTLTGGTIVGVDVSGADVTATGSSAPRSLGARAADVANALNFGADPTGVFDSTTDINNALATNNSVFLPCGTYHITNSLAIAANGAQRLYGEGSCSVITVGSDFNSSAQGVIVLDGSTSQANPRVDNLQITFAQPPDLITTASAAGSGNTVTVASATGIAVGQYIYDQTNSANIPTLTTVASISGNTLTLSASAASIALNDSLHFAPSRAMMQTLAQGCTTTAGGTGCKYPWAVYDTGNAGPVLDQLTISGAWDGINLSRGTYIVDNVRMGAVDVGLDIDNSGDSGSVLGFKFEDLGWISSAYSAFRENTWMDGSTACLNAGRSDGGQYLDIQCFVGNVNILPTFTYGVFHALNLNGVATFNEESGGEASEQIVVDGLFANTGGANGNASCVVNLQGSGSVTIGSPAIYAGGSQTDLCVGSGRAVVTGGILANPGGASNAVVVSETGGDMMLQGVMVTNANQQSVAPVNISGGTYYVLANVVNNQGVPWQTGATVPFINITASCTGTNANTVALNSAAPGHAVSGACTGFAWPNSDTIAVGSNAETSTITVPQTPTTIIAQQLNTVGNGTLTNGDMFSAVLTRGGTQTANFTDTTLAASSMVSYFNAATAGMTFRLRVINKTSFTETVAGGSGVTVSGTATIAAGAWRDFLITLSNVTSGSQAITITNMGGGTL